MKRLRYLLLAVASLLLTLAARPCGPDFPEAVFVLQTGPGGSYARYAAGDLGIPQKSYRTRHMIIAYNYLTGHPLSPAVQKEALALNGNPLGSSRADKDTGRLPGYDAWLKTRNEFGPVNGFAPDSSLRASRSVPGQDYSNFDNCLDDAFATAAKTLAARIAAYGAKDPAVLDWVNGQDAVFTNCGDGQSPRYFGPPDKAPAAPPAPHAPAALPAKAPRWLQQDRAYQLAAASFYHLQFDDALARFQRVAADTDSPWAITARYLVARTYVRSATLLAQPEGSADQAIARQRAHEALQRAQHELTIMRSEPRMGAMRGAIDHLLDYVNLRLDPALQAEVLAQRLQSPTAASFRQDAIDLAWLHSSHDYDEHPVPALHSAVHPNDMLAWIDALYSGDEAMPLRHWQATRSTAWLLAAISFAKPGDAAAPELVHAAQSVPKTYPGWLSITYHRLRLLPRNAATRGEVLVLLQQAESSGDTSRINLLLTLSAASAPTFADWLAAASRVPAGDISWDEEESRSQQATVSPTDNSSPVVTPLPVEDICGKKLPTGSVLPLFDTDAAVVLNRDVPLRLLAEAAEGLQLPTNPRLQVAQATWSRAVLLDKPAIARQMTPILSGCRPAWKPVLAAYDAAPTDDARHAAGLLALMRFASTVPGVWEGEERRQGFATYDEFRQNWWCSSVPKPGEAFDATPDRPEDVNSNGQTSAQKALVPLPPLFLTASDLAEARMEVAALEKIPRASTYFAQQALQWQKLHPADANTPEILGEADRVLRNSCRKDPPLDSQGQARVDDPADMTLTPNLAKALFQMLHGKYPNSSWAKRYKSWQ